MIDATINAGPKGIIIFKVNCFPITDKIKTDIKPTNITGKAYLEYDFI